MATREQNQRYRINLKLKVLKHYGELCNHCGFSDYRALTIDHIENDGAKERASFGNRYFAGHAFYLWLIKNDYPSGYQTLCFNCNNIKQWNLTH